MAYGLKASSCNPLSTLKVPYVPCALFIHFKVLTLVLPNQLATPLPSFLIKKKNKRKKKKKKRKTEVPIIQE